MADSAYRPCVLAVFTNDEGQVLVAERATHQGAWQFPQGGIDPGETAEAAVRREMYEELGCRDVLVVAQSTDSVRYHFPKDTQAPIAKHFSGQDQIWFHLRFAPGARPDLDKAPDKEFVALEWVTPAEALKRAVAFKKEAYVQGLAALGLLPPRTGGT